MQSHNKLNRDYVFEAHCSTKGRMKLFEINPRGAVQKETPWIDNLILDSGLDQMSTNAWANMIKVMKYGDDGTTSTTSMTNLQNELGRSITVPSYDFGDGYKGRDVILDPSNAIATMRQTIDSAVFGSTTTVREIGFGWDNATGNNLFNRVVPPGGIVVNSGNQLRAVYELSIQVPGIPALQSTESGGSTGWPIEYTVTDITSSPTYFDVTTSIANHYVSGGKINISGTTNYDGEWTINSKPSASVCRILDTNNFAQESSGTVKNNAKRKFVSVKYNFGAHFSLSGWTNPSGSDLGRYFACNDNSSATSVGGGDNSVNSSDAYRGFFDGAVSSAYYHAANIIDTTLVNAPSNFPSHWNATSAYHLGGTQTGRTNLNGIYNTASDTNGFGVVGQTYTNGNFYRDYVYTFATGIKNFSNINCIILSKGERSGGNTSTPTAYILFEELQRKLNTHQLSITIRRSWGRM